MKQQKYMWMISIINIINEDVLVALIEDRLGMKALVAIIMNFKGDKLDEYDDILSALTCLGSYIFAPKS